MRRLWLLLTALLLLPAGSAVVPVAASAAAVTNTYLTNPLGFAYRSTANVAAWYGKPTGMVIAGRCNRDGAEGQEFTRARANGAEILAYLTAVSRPDSEVCPEDTEFYGGDLNTTPLWPFPTYGQRVAWPNTHMTDIRAGSAWSNHVVAYIERLMRTDEVDGVFLDSIGGRPWHPLAEWGTWPQAEKNAWAAGNVDLVRRLDAKRRAINPRFIIVNNNVWDMPGDPEVNQISLQGEPYVDGICLELSPLSDYHRRVAGKPYGNLGHRRVLVIARTTEEARQWAAVQGVTHVADQRDYGSVPPPLLGFNRLTDRPRTFGRTTVAAGPSSDGPMTVDFKRGSRFTLTQKATLLGLSAYLDGKGGAPTGSQTVRMALYRDGNGVPTTRLAQSPAATITAGAEPRWINFSAPATRLDPGNYWIVLHSGGAQGIARYYADGPANRYGNADAFADGAADPFGPGTASNTTLSVKATYTVGY